MADAFALHHAKKQRERYQRRRALGLCGCCGKAPPAGYLTCEAYRAKVAASIQKRKVGPSDG